MFLYEVTDAFDKHKLPYAIVGGFALALHGIVRATMDVDIVINFKLADFKLAEQVLKSVGLTARLPVQGHEIFKMRKEYIERRSLIAWSFVDYRNPSRLVDVIITHNRKALSVDRIAVGGRKVDVASLEDLLRMKLSAGRPQDLIDAERIQEKLNAKA